MDQIQGAGEKLAGAGYLDELTEIVKNTLGAGNRVADCTKKQVEALSIIYEDILDKIEELNIA